MYIKLKGSAQGVQLLEGILFEVGEKKVVKIITNDATNYVVTCRLSYRVLCLDPPGPGPGSVLLGSGQGPANALWVLPCRTQKNTGRILKPFAKPRKNLMQK